MPAPRPTRLFHITAIANLPAILVCGALRSKNGSQAAGINYQNIAHAGAQRSRSARRVPDPPGGTMHDFVPFYFAPRSPMLFAINGGRVEGCDLRQSDIAHIETTVERVTEGGGAFVFYDRNATLNYSVPYCDLAMLDSVIGWDVITAEPRLDGFCKYWHDSSSEPRWSDRRERRQAEFLVKHAVPLERLTRIGVIDYAQQARVRAMLASTGVTLKVDVLPDWYF